MSATNSEYNSLLPWEVHDKYVRLLSKELKEFVMEICPNVFHTGQVWEMENTYGTPMTLEILRENNIEQTRLFYDGIYPLQKNVHTENFTSRRLCDVYQDLKPVEEIPEEFRGFM